MINLYLLFSTIIITSLIIFILSYFDYNNNYKDKFESRNNGNCNNDSYKDNYYLNREETVKFILDDNDNYMKSLSSFDLIARKVKTHDQYIYKVINHCLSFNETQMEKLNKCTQIANSFYFNKYRWKFALIDNVYEEGYPHTREDIIILSPKLLNYNEDALIEILIHESIHIYQRYNKEDMKEYLLSNGYTISRKRATEPLIRANPDLDEYIYKDKNNIEMIYKYSCKNPISINDLVKSSNNNEHPFEVMAYEIINKYSTLIISKYKYLI